MSKKIKQEKIKCPGCKKGVSRVLVIEFWGSGCNECIKRIKKERLDFYNRKWKPQEIENAVQLNLNLAHFSFWYLKGMKKQEPEAYETIRKNNPIYLSPENLSLKFAEDFIKKLPREYCKVEEARGHERMFSGGSFELKKNIPEKVFVDILKKMHLVEAA